MDREYIVKHDLLDRYRRNELPDSVRMELEEFILDQPDFIEQLELDMLFESGMLGVTDNSESSVAGLVRPSPWQRYLSITAGVAVALLAASIILNAYLASEIAMLSEDSPQAISAQSNIQILQLPSVLASDTDFRPVGTLLVGSAARADVAIVSVQLAFPEEPAFHIEVITHPDGDTILTFDGVEPRGAGNLVFSIPLDRIEAGEYFVEISSEDGDPMRIPFSVASEML